MSTVLLTGAGFSKGIHSAMPLTQEIAKRVVEQDSDDFAIGAVDLMTEGETLERWLSSLAESQPYFSREVNLTNQARFLIAVRKIQEVIDEGQFSAENDPPPEWLENLVRFIHKSASVITLNYDTLLECVVTRVLRSELNRPELTPLFFGQRVPVMASARPGSQQTGLHRTFPLMKLHGSLDTYWEPNDVTGITVERLPHRAWGEDLPHDSELSELLPPGREPFVIPPAASKGAYYSNPVTTQVWREAQQMLASATRVFIVGYSLPLTDLTIGGLIHSALHTCGRHSGNIREIHVVNPDPDPVKDRLVSIGIDAKIVHTYKTFPSKDGLEPWAHELVDGEDLRIYPDAST